jgi:hypothetical protein
MHCERRADELPDNFGHSFMTLLGKVETIQRCLIAGKRIREVPARDQDHSKPMR